MSIIKRLGNIKGRQAYIIISLVALNFIIKSIYLTNYNIDLDEPFSLFHAQQSLAELSKIFIWENNPPLFFSILHFWVKIFGIAVFATRILPMIFSSLTVIFVYKLGNKYINEKAAIGASLLYTFSNLNIMESHDVRVYSLFVFLTTASIYFYFSLIEKDNRNYLVALTITNILLIYSHFLAFLVIFIEALYTVSISFVRKRILKKILISSFFLLVAYLPYLYILSVRLIHTAQTGINDSHVHFSDFYPSFLNTFSNSPLTGIEFTIILMLSIAYLFANRKKPSIYESMIAGWFSIPFIILFNISFKIQIINTPKYLIFLTPGFFLSLLIVTNHLTESSKFLNVLIILFCVSIMALSSNFNASQGLESQKAITYIKENKTDSTIVYVSPPWTDIVFTYQYNINDFKDYEHYEQDLNHDNVFVLTTGKDIDNRSLATASDILLIDGWNCMKVSDPKYSIVTTLEEKFGEIQNIVRFNGYTVYHFSRQSQKITISKN